MDYQTLRDELLAGSRLPNPTHSIPKISHLIQTCWLADPFERPAFTSIKEKLHESCYLLNPQSVEAKSTHYLALLPDDTMRNKYNLIQECNPMYRKKEDENDEGNNGGDCNAELAELYKVSWQSPSYPYLEIRSTSEAIALNCRNLTATKDGDMLNYVDILNNYNDLENEAEQFPLMFEPNQDDKMKFV